jgi:hypothetical protein
VKLFPFLIAGFLFINPVLERVFRKREIQAEKLQFWVMVTTGTSWVLALVYFLLDPKPNGTPVSTSATDLLPRLAFSLDWISAGLILSAVGLIFVTVLTRQNRLHDNAWLAGLGGACVIGLETNSAYTLGLTWVIIEGFHFYFSYQDRQITSNPRRFLPVIMLRLSAPAALILLSVTQQEPGTAALFTELDPRTGLVLIIVGLLGFLGWFLSFQGDEADQIKHFPGAVENWIPALLGMYLIIRGGAIAEAEMHQIVIPLILSTLLFLSALLGLLLERTAAVWFLFCGLMASVSAIISGAEGAFSWGIVMLLPGIRLWNESRQPRTSLIPLIFATIGLLPVPFLPPWSGILTFSAGVPGIILGLSYGILLGSVLITVLKNWRSSGFDIPSLPILNITGAAAILISQVVISIRLDLITKSQALLDKPVVIWISFLGILPVLIFGNQLPLRKREGLFAAVSRLPGGFEKGIQAILHFLDRLVGFISRIFEGQGGLIWALLIGLLLITLISIRGG